MSVPPSKRSKESPLLPAHGGLPPQAHGGLPGPADSFNMEKEEEEDEVPLIAAQQRIEAFERIRAQHISGQHANNVDQQLAAHVRQMRVNLSEPGFFQSIREEFKRPAVRMSERVVRLLKTRFGFVASHANAPQFSTDFEDCIKEMMSANEFYTKLAFTAYYKRSFFRVLAGVGCTYVEAQLALFFASSIINSILSSGSLGVIQDMDHAFRLLNQAYQSCNKENVIELLKYMGVSPENAGQIYEKMIGLTKEQMKFVLKCLFMRRVVGGIESAEHGNQGGNAAPPPTLMELMSDPTLFLNYLKSIRPGVHGVAGPPALSVSTRAITSFREIMTSVIDRSLMGQLNTVFPDTANDEIDAIIFKILLNLPDDASAQETEIASALLRHQIYTCLEEKAINKRITPEVFRMRCDEVCPGLTENRGLTHETLAAVYGATDRGDSMGSNKAVYSHDDSPPVLEKLASLRESKSFGFMSVLESLKEHSRKFCDQTKRWVGSFFATFREPVREASSISAQPEGRSHAVYELAKTCEAIKTKMEGKLKSENLDEFNRSIDNVYQAFHRTITFSGPNELNLTGPSQYDIDIAQFERDMTLLREVSPPKVFQRFTDALIRCASGEYDHYCQVLSVRCLPFAANSPGAYLATDVIERICAQLEILIEASDKASDATRFGPGFGANTSPAFDSRARGGPAGGRSRSRKHSVSKRTRRKGFAKKQKSKKNKRQSRRKVRRSSSRRSRK